MILFEALVAEETISEPMQASKEMGAVEDVIEVGGMQEARFRSTTPKSTG